MKEILLTKGRVARVSDHWFKYLSQWKWHLSVNRGKLYAARREGKPPHQKAILMHRVIANAPPGVRVDHRDGDGLNNQDENLRYATPTQNSQNRKLSVRSKTGYKGVRLVKGLKIKYRAYIVLGGVEIDLGRYTSLKEAARAYDGAAVKYHGEYAFLNFPEEHQHDKVT